MEPLEGMNGEQSGRPGDVYKYPEKNEKAPEIFFLHASYIYTCIIYYL